MGGIACICGPAVNPALLNEMAEKIKHRGNVEQGLFSPGSSGTAQGAETRPHILYDGTLMNQERFHEGETDTDLILRLFAGGETVFSEKLNGAYALVIHDPEQGLFLARDPLGIIPLYCSKIGQDWYFASEIKAFPESASVIPVPPGTCCRLDTGCHPDTFFRLNTGGNPYACCRPDAGQAEVFGDPQGQDWDPEALPESRSEIEAQLRDCLFETVSQILSRSEDVGVYLSGGLDSSIIAAVLSAQTDCFPTFSVGMKNSEDLHFARLCARELKTEHHEYQYDQSEMIEVLPEVIYHLESYDMALVRSSIPNYILARSAQGHVKTVLSGEGADELFWGYSYMKKMTEESLAEESLSLLKSIHKTGLKRGDRMSSAFGIQARPPFLAEEIVKLALQIPPETKISPEGVEKWILRTAYADLLPSGVTVRKKQKFSQGAGSFHALEEYAEQKKNSIRYGPGSYTQDGYRIRTWEEGMYYEIFHSFFPDKSADMTVGHTEHTQ